MKKITIRDFGRVLLTKDIEPDSAEFRETLRIVDSGSMVQAIVVVELAERGFHNSSLYLALNGNDLSVAHAYYRRPLEAYVIRSKSDVSELSLLLKNGKVANFRYPSLFNSAVDLKSIGSELLASSNSLRRVSACERAKGIRIEQTSRLCRLIRSDHQVAVRENSVSEFRGITHYTKDLSANQLFSTHGRSLGFRDTYQRETYISKWYRALLRHFGGVAPSDEFPCPYSGFARICGETKSRGQTIANWLVEAGLLQHSRVGTVETGTFYRDGSPITQKVTFWRLLAAASSEIEPHNEKEGNSNSSVSRILERQARQTTETNFGASKMIFEYESMKSIGIIETNVSAMNKAVEGVVGLHEDFVENCSDIRERMEELCAAHVLAFENCIERFQSEHEILKEQLFDICRTHVVANKSYSDTFQAQLEQVTELLETLRQSDKSRVDLESKLAEARESLELDRQDLELDRQEFEASLEDRKAEADAAIEEDRELLLEAKATLEKEKAEFEIEKSEYEAALADEIAKSKDALRREEARLKRELESLERRKSLRSSLGTRPFSSGSETFLLVREKVESFLLTLGEVDADRDAYAKVDLNTSITWLMLNLEVKTKLDRLRIRTYGDLVKYSVLDLERSGQFSKADILYLEKKMSYVGISLCSGLRDVDGGESIRSRAESFLEMLDYFAKLTETCETGRERVLEHTEGDTLVAEKSEECIQFVQLSDKPIKQTPTSVLDSTTLSTSTDNDVLRIVRTVPSEKWQLAAAIAEKRDIFGSTDIAILRAIAVGLQCGTELSETVASEGIELYRILERRIRVESSSVTKRGNRFCESELPVKDAVSSDVVEVTFVEAPLVRRVNLID